MLTESISLPFDLPGVYQGLAEGRGMLRAHRDGLILEFQVKDSIFGMLTSDVKEVTLPIEEIASLELRKGWIRTRITIRTTSLKTLSAVIGSQGAEITLRVSRKHRALAEELASMLNLRLCALDLKKMEESLDLGRTDRKLSG
jgi:hypothetical protein